MTQPLVSVIIPVYNREKYIGEAIESILLQTYQYFELIIVDDASTDKTFEIINQYHDNRIRILKNKLNLGVSASRNLGIDNAGGKYLAFMDSDDISVPERLYKQVKLFEANRDVIICGSWIQLLNSQKIIEFKSKHSQIITSFLISSPVATPTVMIRRDIMQQERFKENLRFGEDYDLWSRVFWKGEIRNIPEALVIYRTHEEQLSVKNKEAQKVLDTEIKMRFLKRLNYSVEEFPDPLISVFFLFNKKIYLNDLKGFLKWLEKIKSLNKQQKLFPHKELVEVLEQIRAEVVNKIFFITTDIGLNKTWRLKALFLLSWKEMKNIIYKKGKKVLKIR